MQRARKRHLYDIYAPIVVAKIARPLVRGRTWNLESLQRFGYLIIMEPRPCGQGRDTEIFNQIENFGKIRGGG